ncbi:hypothetical protein TNCT_403051 [Trichonephila clavata]|uniref:Uncharacterized protein n=1 Tax=Trichonephila clavata TaxID=2740835 RepID=A0A8X6FBZ5_TRICU|nr:hypothetical protein TNCT_403051 [Trichonephila clavata]
MMADSKQLENTARIFATKLVHCVMRKYIPNWTPEVAIEDDDIFPDSMKTEIEKVCQENALLFSGEYQRKFGGKEKTNATFEKFCSHMSSLIQDEEENRDIFLYYAAKLARISTHIYENVVEAPNIAIGHITYVLITRYPTFLKKTPGE